MEGSLLHSVARALLQGVGFVHGDTSELDPDVFSEELRRPEYASVETIYLSFLTLTLVIKSVSNILYFRGLAAGQSLQYALLSLPFIGAGLKI